MKLLFIIFLFACTLSVSAQGPQWIVYNTGNSGLPGNSINTIAVNTTNSLWIGTGWGLVKYFNNNWVVYDTNNSGIHTNSIFSLNIDKENNYWMGSVSGIPGGISKFNGTNWTNYNQQNSGIPNPNITDIDFDDDGNVWITTSNGLAMFDGIQWIVYRDTNSILPTNVLSSIEIQNNVIWIGTQSSGTIKIEGEKWDLYNTQNSGLPSNSIYVGDVIKIDSSNNVWIGTFGGGIAKFDGDGWEVYNIFNSQIPSNHITSLLVEKDNILIGTGNRGFVKFFGKNDWEVFNDTNSPLPSNFIKSIAIDSLRNIWIGTPNGLVVHNENGIVSVNNISNEIPKDFILSQNFPNPFNPSTRIKFAIPKSGGVRLRVFDQLGREVRTLVNEELFAGSYEYEFDGSGLASGVYFYRLESGEYVETRRMVILK